MTDRTMWNFESNYYHPFSFHLRRPVTSPQIAKENVCSVSSTGDWLSDYVVINHIIGVLTRNYKPGLENDQQNLRQLGRGKFFFNKMQAWLSLRDKNIGYTRAFNSGIRFDVRDLKRSEMACHFIVKPKEPLYGEGAVYRRFGENAFVILFESGEVITYSIFD